MRAREQRASWSVGKYNSVLEGLRKGNCDGRLMRERDVNRRIFDNLLEKMEQTKISEAENVPACESWTSPSLIRIRSVLRRQ